MPSNIDSDTRLDGAISDFCQYNYRMGFLLAREDHQVEDGWKSEPVGAGAYSFVLCYDPKNPFSAQYDGQGRWVLVLGNVLDTKHWTYSNDDESISRIAKNLLDLLCSKADFLDYTDYLSGRYLIVYYDGEDCCLLQDALGTRSVAYSKDMSVFASHYELVESVVRSGHSPFWEKYSRMEPKPFTMLGNLTPYRDVLTLYPSHEAVIGKKAVRRIWPREPYRMRTYDESAELISALISMQLKILASNENVYIQLTGGQDSRGTLAMSRAVSRDVMYYTYVSEKDPLTKKDFVHASQIAELLDLPFMTIDVDSVAAAGQDARFQKCMGNIHYNRGVKSAVLACKLGLPEDALVVESTAGEVLRRHVVFNDIGVDWSAEKCYRAGFTSFYKTGDPEWSEYFDNFFRELEYDNIHGYRVGEMMYVEHRIGNWRSNCIINQESLAYQVFVPVNTRKILEYAFSTPHADRSLLVSKIIKNAWPLAMWYIPNTDYTLLDCYRFNDNGSKVENLEFSSGGRDDGREPAFSTDVGMGSFAFGFAGEVVEGDWIKAAFSIPSNRKTCQIIFRVNGKIRNGLVEISIGVGERAEAMDASTVGKLTQTVTLPTDGNNEACFTMRVSSDFDSKKENVSVTVMGVFTE